MVGATTVALAPATYGLVSGSMMGGPIARSRVEKHHLKSTAAEEGNAVDEVASPIDGQKFTTAAVFLAVAIGVGTFIFAFFKSIGLTIPTYIGAMLAAAAIRNIWDVQHKDLPMEEVDALGGLSLNLFLAMAMMSLKLWQLAALALPMIVILLVQTVVMFLYANFLVFNIMAVLRGSCNDHRILWFRYGRNPERNGKHESTGRALWSGSACILHRTVSRKLIRRLL